MGARGTRGGWGLSGSHGDRSSPPAPLGRWEPREKPAALPGATRKRRLGFSVAGSFVGFLFFVYSKVNFFFFKQT